MGAFAMTAVDPAEGLGAGSKTKTIMVVDDADFIRRLVSLILKNDGYKVVESTNGKEALNLLSDMEIDMLITDLNMPEMDGIELVRTMRANPAYKSIPVLMLTSEFHETKKQKAYEVGINEWILKPFITKQLMGIVTKYA